MHSFDTNLPDRSPVPHNRSYCLHFLIRTSPWDTNIVYYEILDMQLPYLEGIKRMRIAFHNQKAAVQSYHRIVLHVDKTVGDLVEQLKTELGEDYVMSDIRVMETRYSKVFRVTIPHSYFNQHC